MHLPHAQPPARKPTFVWQGILIVLPVLVLAAVGVFFLRQDRRLALSEATERAQFAVDQLAPRIWEELTATNGAAASNSFRVDAAGNLLFPPPVEAAPVPQPLDFSQLDAAQFVSWQNADAAATEDSGEAIAAVRAFIGTKPPERFAELAGYRLGLLVRNSGQPGEALDLFRSVAAGSAIGESGLPLAPLARFQWVLLLARERDGTVPASSRTEEDQPAEIRPGVPTAPDVPATFQSFATKSLARALLPGRLRVHLESLCSNLVHEPTPLTPHLLKALLDEPLLEAEAALIRQWQDVWNDHERLRRAFASIAGPLKQLLAPGPAPPGSSPAQPPLLPIRAFWVGEPSHPVPLPGIVEPEIPSAGQTGSLLALVLPASEGESRVFCMGEPEAGRLVSGIIQSARVLPAYLSLGVEIAGRRLHHSPEGLHLWQEVIRMTRSGGQPGQQYSTEEATRPLSAAGVPGVDPGVFRVAAYLTNPSLLYRRQSARTFWISCLIIVSAMAALVGLVTGYRAFERQLRLNALKSNFVSSVSHELRAPIASIRLMAENLDRGKIREVPKQQEYFGFIVRECRRLSALIENVLDFSRIDQGRKRYDMEEADIRALVDQTTRLMEPVAGERNVRLLCSHAEAPEFATATLDAHAIQQALVNLIDNALKHSPQGGAVTVSWEARDSRLRIHVQDQGPGIHPAEHEKLFERFYRSGSELRRETQGVGIGLSIVKHIAEAHAGAVRVRSAPGEGSCFTIELPCNAS